MTSAIASLLSIMPPSTDCSAATSCGGVRSNDSPGPSGVPYAGAPISVIVTASLPPNRSRPRRRRGPSPSGAVHQPGPTTGVGAAAGGPAPAGSRCARVLANATGASPRTPSRCVHTAVERTVDRTTGVGGQDCARLWTDLGVTPAVAV